MCKNLDLNNGGGGGMLGSFIRCDVIHSDVIYVRKHYTLGSFIRSDVIR
jgi:hypothetical protein